MWILYLKRLLLFAVFSLALIVMCSLAADWILNLGKRKKGSLQEPSYWALSSCWKIHPAFRFAAGEYFDGCSGHVGGPAHDILA